MKIKRLSYYGLISAAITALIILFFLSLSDQSVIVHYNNPNQISVPGSVATASISKKTILLLLAVGIIGVLGVSRKMKGSGSRMQNSEIPDENKNRD